MWVPLMKVLPASPQAPHLVVRAAVAYIVWGPLIGGHQHRLSLLRNEYVPCHYFSNCPGNLKIVHCHLLMSKSDNITFHYILNVPLHFKVVHCHCRILEKAVLPC